MFMNILMIGNGFDLAHGLPTKYGDFLKFLENINFENELQKNELEQLVKDNIWIDYFLHNSLYQQDNWIDFENEICKVIWSLNDDMVNNKSVRPSANDDVQNFSNKFFKAKYSKYTKKYDKVAVLTDEKYQTITYKEIINRLQVDLNRLTRALEMYLSNIVNNIQSEKRSLDIKVLNPDHILSFNYTNTYERLYGKGKTICYDYIHGKADINKTVESNNMVLGIDEYLPDDRKNKEIEFIVFKKYYQRIYKETGCKYKNWLDEIREDRKRIEEKLKKEFPIQIPFKKFINKNYLYIFGHSLDVTDKDVLRDLILNDNVYTNIYYFNKDVMGQQIANLVKVIGQDELIRRTGGNTKTIQFKHQKEMVENWEI